MSKEIRVDNFISLVDDEDYPLLSRLSWKALEASPGKWYPIHYLQSTKSRNTGISMHQMIMDTKQGHAIVHRNKDTFDNRKENLLHLSFRLMRASSAPKARESSKYKGVAFNKKQQVWRVQCGDKFLGNFKSEIDAAKAYDVEAYNQYGEWAYQNFPEDNVINKGDK